MLSVLSDQLFEHGGATFTHSLLAKANFFVETVAGVFAWATSSPN